MLRASVITPGTGGDAAARENYTARLLAPADVRPPGHLDTLNIRSNVAYGR
jgi:hypothetical protein